MLFLSVGFSNLIYLTKLAFPKGFCCLLSEILCIFHISVAEAYDHVPGSYEENVNISAVFMILHCTKSILRIPLQLANIAKLF